MHLQKSASDEPKFTLKHPSVQLWVVVYYGKKFLSVSAS